MVREESARARASRASDLPELRQFSWLSESTTYVRNGVRRIYAAREGEPRDLEIVAAVADAAALQHIDLVVNAQLAGFQLRGASAREHDRHLAPVHAGLGLDRQEDALDRIVPALHRTGATAAQLHRRAPGSARRPSDASGCARTRAGSHPRSTTTARWAWPRPECRRPANRPARIGSTAPKPPLLSFSTVQASVTSSTRGSPASLATASSTWSKPCATCMVASTRWRASERAGGFSPHWRDRCRSTSATSAGAVSCASRSSAGTTPDSVCADEPLHHHAGIARPEEAPAARGQQAVADSVGGARGTQVHSEMAAGGRLAMQRERTRRRWRSPARPPPAPAAAGCPSRTPTESAHADTRVGPSNPRSCRDRP